MRRYTIGYSRMKHACLEGMRVCEDGTVLLCGQGVHRMCFNPLWTYQGEADWGRLRLETDLPPGSVLTVYAAATDKKEEVGQLFNRAYFEEYGKGPFVNQENILLEGISGQYLWLYIEAANADQGQLLNMRLYQPADQFLATFPEVYQERGSVFHRYVSVFSTLYQDIEEQTEDLCEIFDLDRAPSKLLTLFGRWLGLELVEGILPTDTIRRVLGQTCRLNRIKGTRKAVTEVTEMITGERPVILEKENGTAVVMLRQELTEDMELALLFFLLQFKPVKTRLHIISLEDVMGLDEYCFLDVNAVFWEPCLGELDKGNALEQCIMA